MVKISFLVVLISLISIKLSGQQTYNMPLDATSGKVFYKEVVEENAPKDTLFERAYQWVKKSFPNVSSTITKKDPENGVLECNLKIRLTTTDKKGKVLDGGVIFYMLRIEVKDNRYRIIATEFKQMGNSNAVELWFKDETPEAIAIHQQHFAQIDAEVKKTFANIKENMKAKVIIKDEW